MAVERGGEWHLGHCHLCFVQVKWGEGAWLAGGAEPGEAFEGGVWQTSQASAGEYVETAQGCCREGGRVSGNKAMQGAAQPGTYLPDSLPARWWAGERW